MLPEKQFFAGGKNASLDLLRNGSRRGEDGSFQHSVKNLKASTQAMKKVISLETAILHEMKTLRSKLDGHSISERQLDRLIQLKQELLSTELDLLNDLNQGTSEAWQTFVNCKRRYKTMQDVLDSVCRSVQLLDLRE